MQPRGARCLVRAASVATPGLHYYLKIRSYKTTCYVKASFLEAGHSLLGCRFCSAQEQHLLDLTLLPRSVGEYVFFLFVLVATFLRGQEARLRRRMMLELVPVKEGEEQRDRRRKGGSTCSFTHRSFKPRSGWVQVEQIKR